MHDQILHTIDTLKKKQEPFALATVVWREPPSSGKPGDQAVINSRGQLTGWVGGGCVKGILLKESEEAMRSGKSRLVRIGREPSGREACDVREYRMTCHSEGTIEIFVDAVLPPPHLVVMGQTLIARALVRLAKAMGYRVTAVAADATLQTFEKPDELITRLYLSDVKTSPASFIVIATQGEDDEQALREALSKDAAYIGFVASRRKFPKVREQLQASGFSGEQLARIQAPAGIDIGARRPEEVALSIMAELIQLRNSDRMPGMFPGFLQEEFSESRAPAYYINPVCGVPVDTAHPKHVVEYAGEKIYFCCDGCKVKFDAEPERYVRAAASAE